jgi:hypothetical protein
MKLLCVFKEHAPIFMELGLRIIRHADFLRIITEHKNTCTSASSP